MRWIIVSLVTLLLVLPAFAQLPLRGVGGPQNQGGSPTFDNAAFIAGDTGSYTCSGSNRLLLVAVCYAAGNSRTVTGVTYNGVALTSVGSLNNTTDGANNAVHLWRLIAPSTGSNTVTATISGPPATTVLVVASYTGVNQTTPLGTPTTGSGSNAAQPSINVTSATNELAFDALCTLNSSADTFTANGGQTKRASGDDSDEIGGAVSDKAGAASVAMGWSSPTRYWSQIGVSIKGA